MKDLRSIYFTELNRAEGQAGRLNHLQACHKTSEVRTSIQVSFPDTSETSDTPDTPDKSDTSETILTRTRKVINAVGVNHGTSLSMV